MGYQNMNVSDEDLDTLIDLATNEFEAIGRGEISYGSRDIDITEAAHLSDLLHRMKNARGE